MFGRKKKPKEADLFDIAWGEGLLVVIAVHVLGYSMDWGGAACWFTSMAALGALVAWKVRQGVSKTMRESAADREKVQSEYDAYAARVAGQQRIDALKRDIALAVQRVDILEAQET